MAVGSPVCLSVLGNPYIMRREEDRDRVCDDYKRYLAGELRKGGVVAAAIASLPEDAVLGCFCAPKRCHCDTIVEAWESMHGE